MVVIDLIPLLAAFLAFVVCYALLVSYRSTFGALLTWLAKTSYDIRILGYHPFHWLANGIEDVNQYVNNALAAAVQGTEHAWGKVLHANAVLWHDATEALADLAEATQKYVTVTGPAEALHLIKWYFGPYIADVKWVVKEVKALERAVAHAATTVPKVIKHDVPIYVKPVTKIFEVKLAAIPSAIAKPIGIPLPRIGPLERDIHNVERWISGRGKLVTEAGLAGLLIGALAKVGISWTRCANTKDYGKNICGMDRNLLESLLADTALILGTVSLVEFAEGMQGITKEIEGSIASFWRA
jgi:hypothetical protein